MAVDLIPDYGATQMHGGWVGLYKILSTQADWRYVKENGKPVIMGSYREAREKAKQFVCQIVNRKIPHVEKPQEVDMADILGIEDWRNEKREQLATTQTLRKKKTMKPVIVERKRKGRPNAKAAI